MHDWRPRMLLLVLVFAASGPARVAGQDRATNDCGIHSLYVLLGLWSPGADLDRLRATLPDPGADGLSLAEIQDAAARLGVALRGRRIGPADVPLDRPVLVHLRAGEGPGHFVVLEPAGNLGKSAMVYDFPRPLRVMAYADLFASNGWTGLALAPATRWERAGPWIVSASGVVLATLGLTAIGRTRRFARGRSTAGG